MATRTKAPEAAQTPAASLTDALKASLTEPPADEWAALSPPVAVPDRAPFQGISVNVVETIPVTIRQRAENSLTANAARVKAKAGATTARKRVDYRWDVQPVATVEQGIKFTALLVKYAKYRPADKVVPFIGDKSPKGQVTARKGEPIYYVTKPDGTVEDCTPDTEGAFLGVRYSVRPFEQRSTTARLPGTE